MLAHRTRRLLALFPAALFLAVLLAIRSFGDQLNLTYTGIAALLCLGSTGGLIYASLPNRVLTVAPPSRTA